MDDHYTGDIATELERCRKRFAGVGVGTMVRCCHHEVLVEVLAHPPERRIEYIVTRKPEGQRARRLYEFRPIPNDGSPEYATYEKAWDTYNDAADACNKAWDAYNKAWDTRDEARGAYEKAWDTRDEAMDAYNKEWDAYNKEWDAYNKEWDAYTKAWAAYVAAHRDRIIAMAPDTSWDGEQIVFEEPADD